MHQIYTEKFVVNFSLKTIIVWEFNLRALTENSESSFGDLRSTLDWLSMVFYTYISLISCCDAYFILYSILKSWIKETFKIERIYLLNKILIPCWEIHIEYSSKLVD